MKIRSASLCLLLAACGGDPLTVGKLDVAIVTDTGNGVTYRLTQGAVLNLTNGSGSFNDDYDLGGDAASVEISVPVDSYAATLRHSYGFTDTWPLYRQVGGGPLETVWATLVTPMPMAVTVAADTVTPVVLSFRVPGSGIITFAHGDLVVSAEVEEVAATGAYLNLDGLATLTGAGTFTTTPTALVSRLPAQDSTDNPIRVVGRIDGPWAQRQANRACATLTVNAIPGDGAFVDILLESGEAGLVCATNQGLEITLDGAGPATTDTFGDLGAGEIRATTFIAIDMDQPIFDGQTLDLAALDGNHYDLPITGSMVVDGDGNPWFTASLGGTMSFVFTPTE